MPNHPHSSSSRTLGVLLAIAALIAMAGLAALGATAIWAAADSGSDSPAPPIPHLRPARVGPISRSIATPSLAEFDRNLR